MLQLDPYSFSWCDVCSTGYIISPKSGSRKNISIGIREGNISECPNCSCKHDSVQGIHKGARVQLVLAMTNQLDTQTTKNEHKFKKTKMENAAC